MNKRIYKCLIASPGDTKSERLVCRSVIEEINKGIGNNYGFVVETRMWENDTRSSIGEYSQEVINKQLGNDYEIFIGIMYKKYGTETKTAGSGTEEEFNNAYERFQKHNDSVEIMFYFNDEPANLSGIDLKELEKVNAFKEKISSLGVYYSLYSGINDFENKLRSHLTSYFLNIYKISCKKTATSENSQKDTIRRIFQDRFNDALCIFHSQPIIWIEPILSNTNEISQNPDESFSKRIPVGDILNNPRSVVIKAPPQFGLTSLAHYFVKEAWEMDQYWLYIESRKLSPQNAYKKIVREAESLNLKIENVKCIIIDSWIINDNEALKKLKAVCDSFPNIPIIVMHTINDTIFLKDAEEIQIEREFEVLYLLALPRHQIRRVVSEYNKIKDIGSEDKILSKVVSDLEVLNIHRTPYNCLTLLKVSERYFDESPVNRTNMLDMVLFVLFNMDGIPTYKSKPDLKDCEYVLGRLCENMIRRNKYTFDRQAFIDELNEFCKEKLIFLEVDFVFEVLLANHIITFLDTDYSFRSTFWIFYFAAKRMHIDPIFANYIFDSKIYITCPEIVEFYTGIDRNRVDALQILVKDIRESCDTVESKVRLPREMNLFDQLRWKPTDAQLEKVKDELSDNVLNSGLPGYLKDQHADKDYNQLRPYSQGIQTFFHEYSLYNLMQNISASSRALRNSDYVDPELKSSILDEILRGWNQISKVLLALTPILAKKGVAHFEGQGFILDDGFGNSFEERVMMIIQTNLTNVVGFFKNDIFSRKMAPLLNDKFKNVTDKNSKHQLALLFVFTRPQNWKKVLEEYITSLNKNSFYLYDILNGLRAKYVYDFASQTEINEMSYLIKMCLAKHEFGSKKPGMHEIKKIPNKALPTRDSSDIEDFDASL